MAVTSLQEALPIPDLPASLDGLPEALFSSSWCAYYVPSASYGMISWAAYLSKIIALPCRAGPKLPAALNYSALLPVSVQSITHYSAY